MDSTSKSPSWTGNLAIYMENWQVLGVTLNEMLQDEHVGNIERYIRTVKEHMEAIYNTLPFNKIPARLVVEMTRGKHVLVEQIASKR